VSTLLDFYARKVGGWAMRSGLDTPVVQDTVRLALGRCHPTAGLLQHAERGRHDASQASQALLAAPEIVYRMRCKGAWLANAAAKRGFGTGKRMCMVHRYDAARQEARDGRSASMEMFSNHRRQHSYLGEGSPNA
jgi:putative transposase